MSKKAPIIHDCATNPVIYNNNLYERVEGELFVSYRKKECDVIDELAPQFLGKKIPRDMWKEILSFMKQSYDKFNSETLLYLFYDEKSNKPWSYWVPPQTTCGMTVNSEPNNNAYKDQRKNYPDIMFGTVHHHCSTSAFQSGTDEADEVNREGIHFTVGNLNRPDNIDIHCRITIAGLHSDIPAETYIEPAEDPFKRTAKIPNEIKNQIIQGIHKLDVKTLPENWNLIEFEDDFKNVTKKSYNFVNTNSYQQHLNYWSNWYDTENDTVGSKKTSSVGLDNPLHEEIAEELIDAVQSDYEYEDMLHEYYNYNNDTLKQNLLVTSKLTAETIAADLISLLNDESYGNTKKGKKAEKLIEEFLQQQRTAGMLDFSRSDLEYGLQQLEEYEKRTGIKYLDTEIF